MIVSVLCSFGINCLFSKIYTCNIEVEYLVMRQCFLIYMHLNFDYSNIILDYNLVVKK